ncbi:hypothetical protein K2173_020257 [Erythroxylum novogranatense]|uniref:Uncharacterized protein n=1 Tax=Erythroxylum novogranatense TaxID=1862640 RepID=A0AAV8UAC8_9ROSI|nr:hypothetical protein K2173_020257 [Erythroxylum novogranatense]
MDPFKQMFGTEGCGSSESGWTTYIVSPMEEDDYEFNDHGNHHDYHDRGGTIGNEEDQVGGAEDSDDDSMASDASSGPHLQYKREDSQSSHGRVTSSKNSKEDCKFNPFSLFSNKKKKNKKGRDEEHFKKDRRFTSVRKYSK